MSKRASRISRPLIVAVGIVTLGVAATLVLRRPASVRAAGGAPPQQLQQSSAIAVAAQPAVTDSSKKSGLSKAEKDQIAESPTPAAAVTAIDEALGRLESDPSSTFTR